ncbi:MAG: alpha/beta fold hydrolase [Candidatus Hydrogenedentes bacterium]|nr:alpha/beta fold hydrolase [Candidatus Hydrogenedentota bacterium]
MNLDYPPSTKPTWSLVMHETLSFMAAALLYPFGIRRRKYKPTPRVREQRTVVLVHGYLCNPAVFAPMAAYLRHRGLTQILPFGYPSTRGIEHGAIALRNFLRTQVRGGEIDLVCHSLGGLVARTYLQELGGARRVRRCVTLGTPHYGTYNAYWLPDRVGREMRPGSHVLRRLHETRDACANVDMLSIIAGSDNLVIPRIFARHEREAYIPNLGHMGMLYSPTVWRIVTGHMLGEPLPEVQGAGALTPCFLAG